MIGEKALALMPALEKWVQPKPSIDTVKVAANYMDPQGRLLVKNIYDHMAQSGAGSGRQDGEGRGVYRPQFR